MPPNLNVTGHHGWSVIEVFGDLDLATAPALRQEVVAQLASGQRHLVVDLTGTDFVDSVGLGMIVAARKRARAHGGEVEVVCPEPRLRRVFVTVDLDRVFTLHRTWADAVAGAGDATRPPRR